MGNTAGEGVERPRMLVDPEVQGAAV